MPIAVPLRIESAPSWIPPTRSGTEVLLLSASAPDGERLDAAVGSVDTPSVAESDVGCETLRGA